MPDFFEIPVESIRPNPQQPRKYFDQEALNSLAESIRSEGLLQPILVEENEEGNDTFILVTGERRWRAHKLLGLPTIKAVIRPSTNHNGLQRLVDDVTENVARDDMNCVDEGNAYKVLRDDFGLSVRQISVKIGVKEFRVTHMLKIVSLEPEIQEFMASEKLPHGLDAVNAQGNRI